MMNNDQKLLLVSGNALTIISAIYLSMAGVPNSRGTALLFPLSILGLFFGIGFLVWTAGWLVTDKIRK